MKKKYLQLLIIIVMVFSLTGCTKYLKDSENKPAENIETGQKLPSNVLCQPENKTTIDKDNFFNILTYLYLL